MKRSLPIPRFRDRLRHRISGRSRDRIRSPALAPVRTPALVVIPAAILAFALAACGGEDRPAAEAGGDASPEPTFTAFELEHGVGPITAPVELGTIDPAMATRGEELFQYNCEACHMLEDRFVGPPLGRVLERRSAAFVMNMILNPEQMAREHPEGQKLLAEYPLVMPYQNISEDEARAIVEYLRTVMEREP
jgi:mono/diheme cytochrome c family protein